MAWGWLHKTGSLPHHFDDYNILVITTMFYHWEAAKREMSIMLREAQSEEDWLFQKVDALTHDAWSKPRYTGDPVADAWEAAIARGEAPDLESGMNDA